MIGKSSKREDLVPGFYLHSTSLFYPKVSIPEGNILVTGQCLAAKLLLPAVSFPVLSALLEPRESHFPRTTVQPLLFKIAAGAAPMKLCLLPPCWRGEAGVSRGSRVVTP